MQFKIYSIHYNSKHDSSAPFKKKTNVRKDYYFHWKFV